MKNVLTTLALLLFLGVGSLSAQCCDKSKTTNGTDPSCATKQKSTAVKAYYFHATRRCATCEAVEAVTKEALKEYYGDKVVFESINREEEKENPNIKKYKINGQTLIIVKGDEIVNLTNDAFLNARTSPNKLKSKIKATIDPML
ncbi:MAG: nitrophenyl compound nitroreductase subunit ArsF family protein [Salinivirgaceae bacterium]|nr:nitrophenyl compound nitroreductase subunit ArsF family protein [Salinivirgaceae bacterium]MDD4747101.1 nitrophenyl compound nitroreductase subunit ArsF family protein [Salinivirgaceae bacterium]MDY0282312.1 nitrophenyl compound nitroreductase subunit ArsF family protein [Salinivirgaceae bacterium]